MAVSSPPELNVICVPSVSVSGIASAEPAVLGERREFTRRVGIRAAAAARGCR